MWNKCDLLIVWLIDLSETYYPNFLVHSLVLGSTRIGLHALMSGMLCFSSFLFKYTTLLSLVDLHMSERAPLTATEQLY